MELNKPQTEMNLVQNDKSTTSLLSNGSHVEKLNTDTVGNGPIYSKETAKLNVNEESAAKFADKPEIKDVVNVPCTVEDTSKNTNNTESYKPAVYSSEWASKELLEFVKHMKNGDTSALTQFDVQTLMVDYVQRNNLWDPHQKTQIVCDQRLKNIFGKPRVDHIEMLKLLDFHFLDKEDSPKNLFVPAEVVGSTASRIADGNIKGSPKPSNSRKRKTRKKTENRVAQLDLNEYAAIDVHNINLIYLRRKLMETLMEDRKSFDDKVVGSITRIKISDNDQKPEVHRLVQVIGNVHVLNALCLSYFCLFLDTACLDFVIGNKHAVNRSGMEKSSPIASIGNSQPDDSIETEKLWHYRDPNSKIQGPFSMMQLRKSNTTGLFPPEMRIWTNHEQYDSLLLTDALNGKYHAAPDLSNKAFPCSQENEPTGGIAATNEGTNRTSEDNNKQTEETSCKVSGVLSDNDTRPVKAEESGPSGWLRCWDLLKDGNPIADGVQIHNLLPPSNPESRDEPLSDEVNHSSRNGEKNSGGSTTQNPMPGGDESQSQPNDEGPSSEGNSRPFNIDLSSTILEPVPVFPPVSKLPSSSKPVENIDVLDLLSPTTKAENQQPESADLLGQGSSFLELLSPAPRSYNEGQAPQETDTKQSGFVNLPMPNSGTDWIGPSSLGIGGVQLPDVTDEWCGYSQAPARPPIQEWDSGLGSTSRPLEVSGENAVAPVPDFLQAPSSHPSSNGPNWLAIMNEPIEFVALGEDSVSDLLAEVDAMESRGALPSPTSAIKFARELLEDCKDDCFSSIEDFSSTHEPRKSDALSSTRDVHFTSQPSAPCKPNTSPVDAFDFFRRSSVNSSASSEGETSAPVHSGDAGSEFHPSAPHIPNQECVNSMRALRRRRRWIFEASSERAESV